MAQKRHVANWRWVAGILLATVPVVAGCSSHGNGLTASDSLQGGNGLTARQQHFVNDVRGAGVSSHAISDQDTARIGGTICGALAHGITDSVFDRQFLATLHHGAMEIEAVAIERYAIDDLCPKYRSEAPSG